MCAAVGQSHRDIRAMLLIIIFLQRVMVFDKIDQRLYDVGSIDWSNEPNRPPPSRPVCGFRGDSGPCSYEGMGQGRAYFKCSILNRVSAGADRTRSHNTPLLPMRMEISFAANRELKIRIKLVRTASGTGMISRLSVLTMRPTLIPVD